MSGPAPNGAVAGVLLTGGTSHRMGADKATLRIGEESFATRAARVLASATRPTVEVGPGVSGLRAVEEDPRGAGPLAALLAGVDALQWEGPVVLLACDLPFVDVDTVREIAFRPGVSTVVPRVGGREQFACSRWSARAIACARDAYAAGGRALAVVLHAPDIELVDLDERADALTDVDTPDDLARVGLRAPS